MRTALAAVLFATMALAGCMDREQDDPTGLQAAEFSTQLQTADTIPPRSEDMAGYWELMTDEELWNHIADQDGAAIIGIKHPGQVRGVWEDRILVETRFFEETIDAIDAISGVAILDVGEHFPFASLQIASIEAFRKVRNLPVRDYLQPLYMESSAWMSDSFGGCGWGESRSGNTVVAGWGDVVPPALARMHIQDAWRRNAGENAVIGFTDTGISADQDELRGGFANGASTGRFHTITSVISGGTDDRCGHGTRIAGLAAAPLDGTSVVGAAYKANVVSVRQGDGTSTSFGINSLDAADAIREAMVVNSYSHPERRIVVMSWGSGTANSAVESAVRFNDSDGALHIAASGTSTWGISNSGVVFPASMSEVMAVSAVDTDGSALSNIHYGPQVEVAAYVDALTTGEQVGQIRTMSGSSAPTGMVAGIAALTWTAFPTNTNDQIRARIRSAGHISPMHDNIVGYGIVNAQEAVGGLYAVHLDVPYWVDPYSTFTATATPKGGTGPFTYQWSNGATTSSTTFLTGAEGTQVDYWVTITDTFDGAVRSDGGTAYVDDRSGCSDPDQVIC